MLDSAKRHVEALPTHIPVQVLLSAGTLGSFGWLLLQNRIHPFLIYMLQVYLTF